ncbi:Delta(24)-sterol reductase [Trichoplax sp. H2]|nr:Delta(24)-sterol reductase [Trichoplax sp. H2]|eukprot:RDD37526.1 Delta(24)-sterol reductase [Trichoplax sp. H2]
MTLDASPIDLTTAVIAVGLIGFVLHLRSLGMEYLVIKYRYVFVILFLLPASFFFDIYFFIRNKIIFAMRSAPKQHQSRVENVQNQIKQWQNSQPRKKMCTARPGWMNVSLRPGQYKKRSHQIAVNLVDILNIDTKRQTITVEPLATMGQISATLNPLGWTLAVLPELDDLTVGGLIMGTGVESSSHVHGLFQHICVSYELVLSDGRVVVANEKENSDLFYAVPWSYGTLGFLVSAEIKIVPAKKYVKLNYQPSHSRGESIKLFEEASNDETNDFVEGLMYSSEEAVIMTGTMTDNVEPDKDIIPFGNNVIFRYLFGWMTPPKISLLKLTQTEAIKKLYEKHQIVQDMLVPMQRLNESLDVFQKEFQNYPLWLCPMKLYKVPGFVKPVSKVEEMYVDIGAYGEPKVENFVAKETIRRIEHFVTSVKGFQMLYADSYMTREEFYKMFDHTLYNKLRDSIPNCKDAFSEIYDKVSFAARNT